MRLIQIIRVLNIMVVVLKDLIGFLGLHNFKTVFIYFNFFMLTIFFVSEIREIFVLKLNPLKHLISDWKVTMGFFLIFFYTIVYFKMLILLLY